MRLWRRKKADADEEEETLQESGGVKKTKRTRRTKDELPKPWGKKERLVVFGFMFITVGTSAFLALSSRSWKLPGMPRIALPTGVFSETYVYENKPITRNTNEIEEYFVKSTRDATGVYGFYVVNLNSGESYGVNENDVFQAASLIKLPVMVALYDAYEKDKVDIDGEYILRQEDKVGGAGSIYYKDPGTSYTYRELAWYMGKQSDNTAFRATVNYLGLEYISDFIRENGMEKTSLAKNETTPKEIGILFKKLWERKLVNRANRDEILKHLTDTNWESIIPAGINNIRIAHKYGSELHVINDAGIVFAEDPYVLVLMSKGIVEKEAFELLPRLASEIHKFETNALSD